MCRVYKTVGCLTAIRSHLTLNRIDSFNSINELIAFQNDYESSRQQIISSAKTLVTEERNNLRTEISELDNEIVRNKIELNRRLQSKVEELKLRFNEIGQIPKSYIQEFIYSFKALFTLIKIYGIKLFSNLIVAFSSWSKFKILKAKQKRFQYIDSYFEDVVEENCKLVLQGLEHKKRVIDEINTFIYGAIGEQKVVNELQQLSEDYTLINDFCYTFPKAIKYGRFKSLIKSIQIDHLLVSPAGIFLIETKNWSKESLKNLNLRSPVRQINRTNFALSKILSNNPHFKLDAHHWGERRISIRNLMVIINHKPPQEFNNVKILTLNELLGYIKYFKPSLSNRETQEMANYLIKINS